MPRWRCVARLSVLSESSSVARHLSSQRRDAKHAAQIFRWTGVVFTVLLDINYSVNLRFGGFRSGVKEVEITAFVSLCHVRGVECAVAAPVVA